MRLRRSNSAFTLVELLTVMAVILILAGITLGTFSYANNRSARARAEAEIRALTAACENFKADSGEYPRVLPGQPAGSKSATDLLNAVSKPSYNESIPANQLMYQLLSGLSLGGAAIKDGPNALRAYYEFRPNQLKKSGGQVSYVADPWGNPYGYSTARFYFSNVDPSPTGPAPGYNPTVDLWSAANKPTLSEAWVKNW